MKNPAISRITHHELARWLAACAPDPAHRDEGYLLVDLRSPQDHARGRIPGALQLAMAQLGSALSRHFAPEKVIVVYDERGTRVQEAAERLSAVGFRRLQCLVGGVDAWSEARLPLDGPRAPYASRAIPGGGARPLAGRAPLPAWGQTPRAAAAMPHRRPAGLGRRV